MSIALRGPPPLQGASSLSFPHGSERDTAAGFSIHKNIREGEEE